MAERTSEKPAGNLPPIKPKKDLAKTAGLNFERNDITNPHRLNSQKILPADFKKRINIVQTCFQRLSVYSCVCFRPAKSSGVFGHFGASVKLCSHFADIDRKLLERSKLVLMKDCLQRLQNSLEFIEEIEKNLDVYVSLQKRLQTSHSKRFSWKTFPLKKDRFRELCQTARIHVGHWATLRQKILSDLHLRLQLPELLMTLRTVQLHFFQITEKVCMLVGNLLLRALESCNNLQWQIPNEALKLISQSIDEFNDLLEFGNSSQIQCDAVFSLYNLSSKLVAMLREKLNPHFKFSPRSSLMNPMRPISLTKLLNSISVRRSRMFCTEVMSTIYQNSELQKRLKFGFRYVFDWEDFSFMIDQEKGQGQGAQSHYNRNGIVKVLAGNQMPVLRIEPDSVLLSFEKNENMFINQFVACLATCRTLILPSHSSHSGSANGQVVGHKLVASYPVPVEEVPKSAIVPSLPFAKSDAAPHDAEVGHSILKHHPSGHSPKLSKRVQWSVVLGSAQKEQICSNYMTNVWSRVALELCNMLGESAWNDKNQGSKLRPLPLLSNSVMVLLVQLMEAVRKTGSLPVASSHSLQLASRHLYCMVAVAFWDADFCDLLGISLKDKCKPLGEILDGQPSTKTVQSCLVLLEPLHSVFESATQWKWQAESHESHLRQAHHRSCETPFASIVPSISRLDTLLSFSLYWFDTKIRHFLSAWTLEPLLLLIQWELPLFLDSMNKTLMLVHPLCTSDTTHNIGSTVALQSLWNDTQQKALALETLSRRSLSMFEKDLRKMSTEYFQETMPQGKLWRKSRHAGVPFRPNSYAEHAVTQILEPVVQSTAELSFDIQLSVVTQAVNIMMEAWSDHILKEELVFSFYGGQQIQLDFNYVKLWISSESTGLPSGIQSHLLGLDVFKHLDGAVHLLMLQPRKKKQSANELDVELESNSSTVSSSSVISSLSGVDMEGYDLDVLSDTSIPNRQQWLDLRLRGGGKSKRGLMPFCLRTQET